MQALLGFMWLLVFLALGELLAKALPWPLPGSVLGMAGLVLTLNWARVREPVRVCAEYLLSHLSLLFVPAGVGVMVHWGSLTEHGLALMAVLGVSTLIGLVVTAGMAWWLVRDAVPDADAASPLPPAQSAPMDREQR